MSTITIHNSTATLLADQDLTIECTCGWTFTGSTDQAVWEYGGHQWAVGYTTAADLWRRLFPKELT